MYLIPILGNSSDPHISQRVLPYLAFLPRFAHSSPNEGALVWLTALAELFRSGNFPKVVGLVVCRILPLSPTVPGPGLLAQRPQTPEVAQFWREATT